MTEPSDVTERISELKKDCWNSFALRAIFSVVVAFGMMLLAWGQDNRFLVFAVGLLLFLGLSAWAVLEKFHQNRKKLLESEGAA